MPQVTLITGDALTELQRLSDRSVHCCITSPPYYGLRDYGTAKWEGGDPGCDHTVSAPDADHKAVFSERVTRGDRTTCLRCGARRVDAQLGLEASPEAYVANLVAVFREVKRVLRDDGTLWLNLGSSYWGGKGSNGSSKVRHTADERGYTQSGGTVLMDTRPTDGRDDMMQLRQDLTPEEVAYVLSELASAARSRANTKSGSG